MLSIFAVTPKTSWIGFTFITDKHLLEVVTSSHRSLKVVQLAKCAYIKDFSPLATCHQLTQLAITSTEY